MVGGGLRQRVTPLPQGEAVPSSLGLGLRRPSPDPRRALYRSWPLSLLSWQSLSPSQMKAGFKCRCLLSTGTVLGGT